MQPRASRHVVIATIWQHVALHRQLERYDDSQLAVRLLLSAAAIQVACGKYPHVGRGMTEGPEAVVAAYGCDTDPIDHWDTVATVNQ